MHVSYADLPAKSPQTANSNLLVNNLPSGTKAVDVRTLVSQHGKVFSFNIFALVLPNV